MSFFERILALIFPPRTSTHTLATIGTDGLLPRLAPHIVQQSPEIIALLPYKEALVHAAILETKYHRNTSAAQLLGGVLAEYLLPYTTEETALASGVVLVPIPLSPAREKKRGYNQVEVILHAASRFLPTPLPMSTNVLVRTRDTTPQTTLKRTKRIANMRSAFRATTVDSAVTYIVIDDVVTTGATLGAARDALIQAGASRVLLLALAH